MTRKYFTLDGRHRPPLKVAVNTVLRLFQPFSRKKLVIASVVEEDAGGPVCTGYRLAWVLHA